MKCPYCSNKDMGKIGRKKYFCSNCFSEIVVSSNKFKVISLNEKGIAKVVKTCSISD
ncbi:hypothetical protein [Anaerofustis stercorihominis]|uniref:Uncharacterized protein n=1 Tax=Anaerofustis stercorihominis DSM 17244 TaxID=445971 RepID=B1C8W5_9FIRM|nr:hypothetical protein [Anaerofustis stercorihominis]EDS72025.1 hypothetical protein ANASTE_01733 [Anaerofustis stercorihominis DSM 17244]MCQ4795924.1 hypothetical protein [Anaerofustis stercorihominis]MCR2032680.1 hypothetical protein [Anaerofustis stercorihominis]